MSRHVPQDHIFTVAEATNDQLQKIYENDLGQARNWLIWSLVSGGLAFSALLGIGVGMAFGQASLAIATTVLQLLLDAFTGFFVKQLIDANKQVLNDREKLSQMQRIFVAIDLAQTTDPSVQDHYKGRIILLLSGLTQEQDPAIIGLDKEQVSTPQNLQGRSNSQLGD